MKHETGIPGRPRTAVHSLIPLEDFKAILGLDDREDKISAFCLVTATFTIEQYCMRRLLRRKNTDYLTFTGDHIFSLREYPVREVLAVYALDGIAGTGDPLEPDYYRVIPDLEGGTRTGPEDFSVNGDFSGPHAVPLYSSTRSMFRVRYEAGPEDMVYSLSLCPALLHGRGFAAVKAVYRAGYFPGKVGTPFGVPADLASACLELAAWNMVRYRGRRIGMTGNIRGSGKEGEHLEPSMPENVRCLLEPYRRKVI
jgi:hypothetical protein